MDELNLDFLWRYYPVFARGLFFTVLLSVVATISGLVFGIVVVFGRSSRWLPVRAFFSAYVEFFRNTPLLIQLFFFQAFVPKVLDGFHSPIVVACVSFSLYNAAYCGEIFRAGIQSIERGQWDAGRALGMSFWLQARYIVVPQAVKRVLPAFTTRFVEIFKLTALASTVAYGDLLYVAKNIAEVEYRPIETFTMVAIIFVVVLMPLSVLAHRLEGHINRNARA